MVVEAVEDRVEANAVLVVGHSAAFFSRRQTHAQSGGEGGGGGGELTMLWHQQCNSVTEIAEIVWN